MSVRAIDVAPAVSNGERMFAHIIVCIEGDVRNIVAGVTDENISAAVNDIEIIVIW